MLGVDDTAYQAIYLRATIAAGNGDRLAEAVSQRLDQLRDKQPDSSYLRFAGHVVDTVLYMERDYIVPEKFEDFVYIGLVLQGHGMRHGMEAHRRNRPYCMGTLYWQLNDSWPVVSWSSIDYYGNWKALHYQAKRAFAPLLVNAIQEGDSLNIYLISDMLEKQSQLTLEMKVIDFNGKTLDKEVIKAVEVAMNTSSCIVRKPLDTWVNPDRKSVV